MARHASIMTRIVLGVSWATMLPFASACAAPVARPQEARAAEIVIASPAEVARPPFRFAPEDEKFLEEVQRGAFNFLWMTSDPAKGVKTGMAPDRTSKPAVSIAGVGFELTGICIAVERGWITRAQGQERAELILRSLAGNPENRKAGLFFHFLDPQTAGQPKEAYERVVSTIDSALLLAGVLTASQYFGGSVRELGDQLFAEADWKFFVASDGMKDPQIQGFITLGWKPDRADAPTGEGKLLPYAWIDSGDEHRLVTFLAACAPSEAYRVDPSVYYRLRRQLGSYKDTGPFVWFPWSGALFTALYAHCWIDYAGMSPDDPAPFAVPHRARLDWWENSRRTVHMHRIKALENPQRLPGLGVNGWGLTASDVKNGYAVPGLFPDPLPMPGAQPGIDYAVDDSKSPPTDFTRSRQRDNYGDGTLAPYGAGCSIMFEPREALAALHHYRRQSRPDGQPPLWSDPATGGFGFQDAFNPGTGWVAPDCLAIDQGALLVAIENARTGLVWRTFHAHPFVAAGMERLKLSLPPRRTPAESGSGAPR